MYVKCSPAQELVVLSLDLDLVFGLDLNLHASELGVEGGAGAERGASVFDVGVGGLSLDRRGGEGME